MDLSNFFAKINNSISFDDLVVLLVFGTYAIFWICFAIGIIIYHFLLAIPLYIMADKAGYAYPFLAFIPFANYYLVHVIPMKEYNFIGLFKTYERKNGFLFFLGVKYFLPLAVFAVGAVCNFIPILGFLISMVLQLVALAGAIVAYIAKAIMMIDLYETYIKDDKAIPILLGVIGLFVPLLFPIACYFICNKEPEFGFGNYYYPVVYAKED